MDERTVSLVIPGRNCEDTLRECLSAVVPMLDRAPLREIIFVDDGSTDDTRSIAESFPVTYLRSDGRGAGAARNTGWRHAQSPLIWFVDSDCVAEPDALERLVPHMDDPKVGGVSGSYGIMNPESLLACLIHEEIIERHRTMPPRVNFLATFNVLYRRSVLENVDGFDPRYLKGQDAELSFRVQAAGYDLAFEFASRVGHYHEDRWLSYLRIQRQQGYWRVFLHMTHKGHSAGDSYSRLLDHVQPPLAMLALAMIPLPIVSLTVAPLAEIPGVRWAPLVPTALLAAAQVPMSLRIARRLGSAKYLLYGWMSFVRSFWRGVGMAHGCIRYFLLRDAAR